MQGILKLKTAPAAEPVSASEAKSYMRVDITDDDTLIGTLITAARRWVENITGNKLISQTWYWYIDDFPAASILEFPVGPVSALASIKYTNDAGTQSTMTATDYETDFNSEPPNPARVSLAEGKSWPSEDLKEINGVLLEFTAGYGAAGSNVPAELVLAVKMMIEHFYEHRGAVTELQLEEAPLAVQALLAPYMMRQRGRD